MPFHLFHSKKHRGDKMLKEKSKSTMSLFSPSKADEPPDDCVRPLPLPLSQEVVKNNEEKKMLNDKSKSTLSLFNSSKTDESPDLLRLGPTPLSQEHKKHEEKKMLKEEKKLLKEEEKEEKKMLKEEKKEEKKILKEEKKMLKEERKMLKSKSKSTLNLFSPSKAEELPHEFKRPAPQPLFQEHTKHKENNMLKDKSKSTLNLFSSSKADETPHEFKRPVPPALSQESKLKSKSTLSLFKRTKSNAHVPHLDSFDIPKHLVPHSQSKSATLGSVGVQRPNSFHDNNITLRQKRPASLHLENPGLPYEDLEPQVRGEKRPASMYIPGMLPKQFNPDTKLKRPASQHIRFLQNPDILALQEEGSQGKPIIKTVNLNKQHNHILNNNKLNGSSQDLAHQKTSDPTLDHSTNHQYPRLRNPRKSLSCGDDMDAMVVGGRAMRLSDIAQLDNYIDYLRNSGDETNLSSLPTRLCCARLLRMVLQKQEEMYAKGILHSKSHDYMNHNYHHSIGTFYNQHNNNNNNNHYNRTSSGLKFSDQWKVKSRLESGLCSPTEDVFSETQGISLDEKDSFHDDDDDNDYDEDDGPIQMKCSPTKSVHYSDSDHAFESDNSDSSPPSPMRSKLKPAPLKRYRSEIEIY